MNAFASNYDGHTTVHPLGLAIVLLMGVLMLFVSRRYVLWPMIVVACFVSPAQRLVVAGADFNFLRLLVVFGGARVILCGELRALRWNALDLAVMVWASGHVVMGLILVGPSILMNKLGFAFDAAGVYLLFRILVRDWAEVKSAILGFTLISVPVALAFILEALTARNIFAVFGGVPEITAVRDGRLRCQGAFAHPILAGLFWASLLPLIAIQWRDRGTRRLLAVVGVVSSLFIIVACASASPITGVMFAAIGGAGFFVRYRMRLIRWGVLLILIGLHMVMLAPVWHLISRLDIVGGNSGYHRFLLIDSAIKHADEWWLIGSTVGTGHWGYFMFDVTNYYIVQGLHGGLLLLALFVAIISLAFRAVGKTWRAVSGNREQLLMAWALGVSLFVHTTSFLVISYFGQINMVWYLVLAMIGSLMPVYAPSRVARVRTIVNRRPIVEQARSTAPMAGVATVGGN